MRQAINATLLITYSNATSNQARQQSNKRYNLVDSQTSVLIGWLSREKKPTHEAMLKAIV
jgi:hypothetical protein